MKTASVAGASFVGAVVLRAAIFGAPPAHAGDSPPPGIPLPPLIPPPPPSCVIVQGARLVPIPTTSPDGMTTFSTAVFVDSRTMVNCTARATTDGSTYCAPVDAAFGGEIVFTDATCQTPLAHFAATQPAARFVGVAAPGTPQTTGPLAALYSVDGVAPAPAAVYAKKSDGTCVPAPALPADDPVFTATPIDLTSLVRLTIGHDVPQEHIGGTVCANFVEGTRLKLHTVSADSSLTTYSDDVWFDSVLGTDCAAAPVDGGTRCFPLVAPLGKLDIGSLEPLGHTGTKP